MIELKSKDLTFGGIFYFHTMKDCNDFLYVFSDHWCNVPWESPKEISDDFPILESQRWRMDIPPKKRAEDSLSWGFSLVRRLGIDIDENQNSFVKDIVEKLS